MFILAKIARNLASFFCDVSFDRLRSTISTAKRPLFSLPLRHVPGHRYACVLSCPPDSYCRRVVRISKPDPPLTADTFSRDVFINRRIIPPGTYLSKI